MSIRCEGCGLEYAGGRGLHGHPRPALAACSTRGSCGCCCRSGASTVAPWPSCGPADEDDLTTYGEFLAAEGFCDHFLAHYAVPGRVLRLVRRRGDRPAVPGPLPVPVPRPPRHAAGDRLAAVVHRRRRVPHLRRAARRAAARGPRASHAGHRRHPPRRRRRGARRLRARSPASTASSSPPTPTRRSALLDRPDRRRGHDAEAVRLLPQRDRAAHRRARSCRRRGEARASWNYRMASCGNRQRPAPSSPTG